MRSLYPEELGPLQRVQATGPAPVLMRFSEWLRVTPEWEALTAQIEADAAAKEKLGWVREMYAFSIACAKAVRLASPRLSPLPCAPSPALTRSFGRRAYVSAFVCWSGIWSRRAPPSPIVVGDVWFGNLADFAVDIVDRLPPPSGPFFFHFFMCSFVTHVWVL